MLEIERSIFTRLLKSVLLTTYGRISALVVNFLNFVISNLLRVVVSILQIYVIFRLLKFNNIGYLGQDNILAYVLYLLIGVIIRDRLRRTQIMYKIV